VAHSLPTASHHCVSTDQTTPQKLRPPENSANTVTPISQPCWQILNKALGAARRKLGAILADSLSGTLQRLFGWTMMERLTQHLIGELETYL
jgi:hypothetical protein